jgi:hypothetical protein
MLEATCESHKRAIVASLSSMIVEDLEFLDNVGPVDTVFKREVMPQARSLSQAEVDACELWKTQP